jgi:hypothetical protein
MIQNNFGLTLIAARYTTLGDNGNKCGGLCSRNRSAYVLAPQFMCLRREGSVKSPLDWARFSDSAMRLVYMRMSLSAYEILLAAAIEDIGEF